MLKIAYSEIYKYDLPEGHRFPMVKYDLLPQQLLYEGIVNADNFFKPQQLTEDQLLTVHTPEYLHKLEALTLTRKEVRKIGFPVKKSLVERGKFISSGTYQCGQFALANKISLNIAGGTHHAFPDYGEGFCIYNDMALATRLLRKDKTVNRVLFIDLDVHQGNGNAFIFQENPEVFTFSMHGANNYPLRKEISDLDVGVPDGIEDKAYLSLLKENLSKAMALAQPDLAFFQAGVDILKTDKLGRLAVTLEGCKQRDRYVMETCKQNDVPLVVTMGGGYSEKLYDIIEAHTNTYRMAQEVFF